MKVNKKLFIIYIIMFVIFCAILVFLVLSKVEPYLCSAFMFIATTIMSFLGMSIRRIERDYEEKDKIIKETKTTKIIVIIAIVYVFSMFILEQFL